MINEYNIFTVERNGKKKYFCVSKEKERKCEGCNNFISDVMAIFNYSINNGKGILSLYHTNCKNKISKKGVYQERGLCFFMISPIPNSTPVLFGNKSARPSNNNISVFEASSLPSDKTEDKTLMAGRESLEGAKVGLIDQERLEELESPVKDIDRFLSEVCSSELVIEHEKKPKLEFLEGEKK